MEDAHTASERGHHRVVVEHVCLEEPQVLRGSLQLCQARVLGVTWKMNRMQKLLTWNWAFRARVSSGHIQGLRTVVLTP
jgi:hypothetical protein